MGMHQTLDCFQTEWYELQDKGLLPAENIGCAPDIYTKNQCMVTEIQNLQNEAEKLRMAARKANEMFTKLRKERDYHRMHHRRVVQEKNRLITDLKRMKDHYACYEPTLRQLKCKYEVAMKEKMLTKLEKDRAVSQVQGLKSTLKTIEDSRSSGTILPELSIGTRNSLDRTGSGPTQKALADERAKWNQANVHNLTEPRHPNDSKFPQDLGINPRLACVKQPAAHLIRSGGLRLSQTFKAHSHAVSSVALHPRKPVLATTSDDHLWKVWSIPNGDVILTGRGHTDWVADCDFHPSGAKLVTAGGDTTVKIWDFAKAECIHTFMEHQKPVWGCSWHSCGDFVASCSMDNSSKIWDLNSLRCRYTLRGHTDSVNSIEFLPFSNTLITCSADKTVSLWDARTGICAQTFYGHSHSVNHCTFNMRGDTVASCDSYGNVNLWDVRTVAPMTSANCGPHAANAVAFDPSGSVLAIASNDSLIRIYDLATAKISKMVGHEDAVQCLVFDYAGEFLVSCGSDHTVRIWS